jgi:hypothetical protein
VATDDLLARIRTELEQRMAQLRPLLSEYERLIAAAETLATIDAEDLPPEVSSAAHTPQAQPEPTRRRGRGPRGSAAGAIGQAASTPAALELLEPGDTTHTDAPVTSAPSAPPPGAPAKTRRGARATPVPAPAPSGSAPVGAGSAPVGDQTHQPAISEPFDEEDEEGHARRPVTAAEAQQAILAALEHGSHTVSELVMVTAMRGSDIRASLSRLTRQGKITKVKREGDGKTAHSLPSASASG